MKKIPFLRPFLILVIMLSAILDKIYKSIMLVFLYNIGKPSTASSVNLKKIGAKLWFWDTHMDFFRNTIWRPWRHHRTQFLYIYECVQIWWLTMSLCGKFDQNRFNGFKIIGINKFCKKRFILTDRQTNRHTSSRC